MEAGLYRISFGRAIGGKKKVLAIHKEGGKMRQMDNDYQQQQQDEERRRQEDEDPCADRCFLKEHKGYDTCAQAECCLYEQMFGGSPRG